MGEGEMETQTGDKKEVEKGERIEKERRVMSRKKFVLFSSRLSRDFLLYFEFQLPSCLR